MIPKIIHYCWFGGNPLPKLAKKCIKSWKKYCPDYEIICWDESNFDISKCPLYVRQAYDAKKWAFVSDYVRLKLVYEYGGIYMDTDVELFKPLDSLLSYTAYFGFENNGVEVATGLGFGAEKGTPILRRIMLDYEGIPFYKEDGSIDTTCCPQRNTQAFVELGLRLDDTTQILPGNILVLEREILCPIGYWRRTDCITERSISAHWYTATWLPQDYLKERDKKLRQLYRKRRIEKLKKLPNRVFLRLLGTQNYEKLKAFVKKRRIG